MKLFFEEITGKTKRYSVSDTHWFPAFEVGRLVAATVELAVSRSDRDTVLIKGRLDGVRETICDRCGGYMEDRLDSEFVYRFRTGEEDTQDLREMECSDEDAVTHYLQEPVIEIDDVLREQAYLAVPLSTLCRTDCKGICAGCGASLNKETCRCTPDSSSSPFAVLGKIKNQ